MKFKNIFVKDIHVDSKLVKVGATFETEQKSIKSQSREIKNLVNHEYIEVVKSE